MIRTIEFLDLSIIHYFEQITEQFTRGFPLKLHREFLLIHFLGCSVMVVEWWYIMRCCLGVWLYHIPFYNETRTFLLCYFLALVFYCLQLALKGS